MTPQTTPNFVLSPCTPHDVPGMAGVYIHAFQHNPISVHCFPPSTATPSIIRSWLHTRFSKTLTRSWIRVFKIVDTSTNELVAFAKWSFPHVLTEEEKKVEEKEKAFRESERKEGRDPSWPQGANLELLDSKFGDEGLGGMYEKWVKGGEMYVTNLLATSPSYQRMGLGKMLLKYVLDLADQEGRKAYIEATENGYPLYVKMGFKEVGVVYVDCTKWGGKVERNRVMVREPVALVEG